MTSRRPTVYHQRVSAAKYVREQHGQPCSAAWLAKLAVVGGGPPFRKAGRTPLYAEEDLDEWALSRLSAPMHSTSKAS